MKRTDTSFKVFIVALILSVTGISAFSNPLKPIDPPDDKTELTGEIIASLKKWNDAAKDRDTSQFMGLFDHSATIMLVGSDSGEIFKGREQIE
jgi:hypothetical protein